MSSTFRPATTYPAIVGFVLQWHRDRLGATQEDLARRVGLSPSTWSRIERGECALTMDQLAGVARVLGVQPAQILADADNVERQLAARGVHVQRTRVPKPFDSGLALVAGVFLGALVASVLTKEEAK